MTAPWWRDSAEARIEPPVDPNLGQVLPPPPDGLPRIARCDWWLRVAVLRAFGPLRPSALRALAEALGARPEPLA